jgi:hypothetical protein
MRALPADSFEYLGETAEGNVALPIATGAGAGLADVVTLGDGAADTGSLGVASAPHSAFRKSFHFMPLRVPASPALYILHCIPSLKGLGPAFPAKAVISAPPHVAMYRMAFIGFLVG